MAKPRVHEIAAELGVTSKDAMKALKSMGEFVKGPSSSIEPPLARKLRKVLEQSAKRHEVVLPIPRQDGEHPSAYAARVRRTVVSRFEPNWLKYDFDFRAQREWTDAGIPVDMAHLAAMCRDTMDRTPNQRLSLAPQNLKIQLGEDTVAQALIAGTNSVRVQARLAAARELGATGVSRTLATLVNESPPISVPGVGDARSALEAMQWAPKTVPQIANLHRLAIELSNPLLAAHVQLREQAGAFREGGEVGPVLASYGRIHGVFHPDEWMRALLDGIERDAETYRDALSSAQLIAAAATSRRFVFVASAPTEESLVTLTPESDELIGRAGYALIAGDQDQDSPERVLVWVRTGDTIRSTVGSNQSMLNGLPKGADAASRVDEWTVGQREDLPLSAQLVRLIAALDRDHEPPRAGVGRSATNTGPQPIGNAGSAENHDVVVVYRGTGEGNDVERAAAARRRPEHRWMVSGHYRRQWYRSEQQHKRIWIDSHEAGPVEAPLIVREHVHVVRERR